MFDQAHHACHDRRDGDGEIALREAAENVDYEMISARSSTHVIGSATSDKELGQLALHYTNLWYCGHRKTISGAGLPDPTSKSDFMNIIRFIHKPTPATLATLAATATAATITGSGESGTTRRSSARARDTTEDSSSQVCRAALTTRGTIHPSARPRSDHTSRNPNLHLCPTVELEATLHGPTPHGLGAAGTIFEPLMMPHRPMYACTHGYTFKPDPTT